MTRYKSAVDGWFVAAVVMVPAALLVPALLLPAGLRWMVLPLLLAAVLPFWLLLTTDYRIDGHQLLIRSGPFRWAYDIRSIVGIEPTRSPLSGPALSLDRLLLRFDSGACCLVSPRDPMAFAVALKSRGARLT